MTAYITAAFTPKNREMLKTYSAKAAIVIAKYEGEFLIKAPIHALVGTSNYEYKAIIAFPTKKLAESWFKSKEYQDLTAVRDEGMDASFLLIG